MRQILIAIACMTTLLGFHPPAHAQTPTRSLAKVVKFDIPPQKVSTALIALSQQAGIQVLMAGEVVDSLQSAGVQGEMSIEEAVSRLLEGTHLRFRQVGQNAIGIEAQSDSAKPVTSVDRAQARQATLAQADPEGAGSEAGPGTESSRDRADESNLKATLEEVVVTGTHIGGSKPIAPVQTISRQDINASGYTQLSDLMASLPSNFGGGQNPAVLSTGTGVSANDTGASTINLRGLGPGATLVLLNGHRLPGDGGFIDAQDISPIPLAAIDHIDIVPDGASALYGSDAVAGVVNFIMRTDYNGAEASATLGKATQGGGLENDYNLLGGHAWSTGHALLSVEYLHQNVIYAAQRDFTSDAIPSDTLLPSQNRTSVYVDIGQEINDWASLRLDGDYSQRGSWSEAETLQGFALVSTRASAYMIDPQVRFKLPSGWVASIDGSISRNADYLGLVSRNVTSTGDYVNYTRSVELAANGTALTLPTGDAKLALGAGYRQEGFQQSGQIPNVTRSIRSVYGEVLVPLVDPSASRPGLERLELSAAGRFERYSDFGTTSNPKVALAYAPFQGLTARGSWGTSFKAPTFYDMYYMHDVEVYPAALIGGPQTGTAMFSYGGNPDLHPERAKSWTAGLDYVPPSLPTLDVSATYFDVRYTDRIALPITNALQTLSDPDYAPFVIENPTLQQVGAVAASSPAFRNYSGAPFDPSQVVAIGIDRYTNTVAQNIHGVDLSVRQSSITRLGNIDLFANATWQRLVQQTSLVAPVVVLSGTYYYTPKERARGGVTWSLGGVSATAAVNYISGEANTNVAPTVGIASWTTFDLSARYLLPPGPGPLSGFEADVAVTNLLNRDPPYALGPGYIKGINYDSTNTSAVGRFVALTLRKRF